MLCDMHRRTAEIHSIDKWLYQMVKDLLLCLLKSLEIQAPLAVSIFHAFDIYDRKFILHNQSNLPIDRHSPIPLCSHEDIHTFSNFLSHCIAFVFGDTLTWHSLSLEWQAGDFKKKF